MAEEGLLQDFFVSSLSLLQGAHNLCPYPTWGEHNTSVEHQDKLEAILSLTLHHSSWGTMPSWAHTLETASCCTSPSTIPLCNDTF